jgi:hypothetical protein
LTLEIDAMTKATQFIDLPDLIKGDWCNVELAAQVDDSINPEMVEEIDYQFLKGRWARDLLVGDLKAAHKAWGRWKGFTGGDPWEDPGWSNFLELQRFGETLWEDFDASRFRELVWLSTFISYWPGVDWD